jgi:hypothetical protein
VLADEFHRATDLEAARALSYSPAGLDRSRGCLNV